MTFIIYWNFYMLEMLPSKMQQILMLFFGILGACIGEMPHAFNWLCIMMLVDYITGVVQSFKNKNWSSKTGFRGIIKKCTILVIVILFHGLSDIILLPVIDTAVISAFAINEICSVLENVERMGLGDIIPTPVRKLLDVVTDKEDDIIDKLK